VAGVRLDVVKLFVPGVFLYVPRLSQVPLCLLSSLGFACRLVSLSISRPCCNILAGGLTGLLPAIFKLLPRLHACSTPALRLIAWLPTMTPSRLLKMLLGIK